MSCRHIINKRALVAEPWNTPMLFCILFPYCWLYFACSVVLLRPPLMCCIVWIGSPFLYNVAQSIVLFTVPNALLMSMSRMFGVFSFVVKYCSTFIIASSVELFSLYPYWLLLVSMCSISASLIVVRVGHILYAICRRLIGL